MIRLFCECTTTFPGLEWVSEVEFRDLKHGYSIWRTDDNVPLYPSPRLIKVGGSRNQLSWREAVAWLMDLNEYPLMDDSLVDDISVSGVLPWQADLLRIAWIRIENSYLQQLTFLMKFPDEEIEYLWDWHESFISREAFCDFQDLIETISWQENGLEGKSLRDIFNVGSIEELPDHGDLHNRLNEITEPLDHVIDSSSDQKETPDPSKTSKTRKPSSLEPLPPDHWLFKAGWIVGGTNFPSSSRTTPKKTSKSAKKK